MNKPVETALLASVIGVMGCSNSKPHIECQDSQAETSEYIDSGFYGVQNPEIVQLVLQQRLDHVFEECEWFAGGGRIPMNIRLQYVNDLAAKADAKLSELKKNNEDRAQNCLRAQKQAFEVAESISVNDATIELVLGGVRNQCENVPGFMGMPVFTGALESYRAKKAE